MLRLPGARGLFAGELFRACLLDKIRDLGGTGAQCEFERRVAFAAYHVDVGPVAHQQIDHLRVAACRGIHERRVTVLGHKVGIEVHR